jgi:hypothetical protein
MRRIVPALLLVALAMPALAADPSAEDVARLLAAIEKAGCRVTEANNAEVLKQSGLTEEQAGAIVDHWFETGEAAPDDSDLVLKTGNCK